MGVSTPLQLVRDVFLVVHFRPP